MFANMHNYPCVTIPACLMGILFIYITPLSQCTVSRQCRIPHATAAHMANACLETRCLGLPGIAPAAIQR